MIPDSLSTKTLIRLFAVICVALFCITFLHAQGNAITLNGTSQYATLSTIAADMASNTTHTIEFWFKAPSQVDAGQVSLFAVNSSTGGNVVLFLMGNNAIQTGKIYVYDGASATVIDSSNSTFLDNAPHHFAFVRNGATGTFYVDGALQGSGSCTYAFAGTNIWSAGVEYDSGPTATDFFKGSIDDIRVWNAARSIDTIQAHMFSLSAANSNLKGWWKCDEASGTTLNDASGLSNTGTLVGSPTFASSFIPTEPTVAASNIVRTNPTTNSMTISWTRGDGDGCIVVVGNGGDGGPPIDGKTYTASSAWGSGTYIYPNAYVVYKGTGNSVTITNMNNANQTYGFAVYEYKLFNSIENYKVTNFNTWYETLDPEPTVQASNVSFSSINTTSFTVNWTRGNGDSCIVLLKAGSAVNSDPLDGTPLATFGLHPIYNASSVFQSGAQIGTGNYVVYNRTGTSVTVTGLTPGTTYYAAVYELNGRGDWTNFMMPPATGNAATLTGVPTLQASNVTFSSVTASSMTVQWTNGNGSNRLVVVKAGSTIPSSPVDGNTYTASTVFGSGNTIGTGVYVVYGGTGSSVNVTGLAGNTTYYVAVFEFNTVIGTTRYLLTPATGNTLTPTAEPTTQASAVSFSSVTTSSMNINWTNGNGAKRIVLMKAGSAVDSDPVDVITYSSNGVFGSGSELGSGNYVVYDGTGNTVPVTGLVSGTTYHIAVYEYNGNPGLENYRTSSPARSSISIYYATVTGVSPVQNALNVPTNASIQIIFSAPVLPSSFDDTVAFSVTGVTRGQYRGTIAFSAGNTIATFTPTVLFKEGELVTVQLTGALQIASTGAVKPFGYAFTTAVGSAAGTFTSHGYLTTTGGYCQSVVVNDVDRDGDGDIIVISQIPSTVTVFRNDGFGSFPSSSEYTLTATNGGDDIVVADFDGDGYGDIAASHIAVDSLFVLKNNGDGTFSTPVTYRTGTDPYELYTSDLDGDGDRDIVTSNLNSFSLSVFKNNGDGTFAPKVDRSVGVNNNPSGISIHDLDGDGDADIAVAGDISGGSLHVLMNNGDGTFPTMVNYSIGSNPGDVSIEDIDGDGDGDILVGSSDRINIFKNNGDGTLQAKVEHNTGTTYLKEISVGDIDGDGDMDLNLSVYEGTSLSIQKNNGDGTFEQGQVASPWTQANASFISDIDGNGRLDIVLVMHSSPGRVYIYGDDASLPVELISFNASTKQSYAELKWNTATEINNYGFEVERKAVGVSSLEFGEQNPNTKTQHSKQEWSKAGFVEGSGTTNAPKEYSFTDINLSGGKYSYRLKQIDRDGKFEYSKEVEVTVGSAPLKFALAQNYPNPFNPTTNIEFTIPATGQATLIVFNAIGQEVATLFDGIAEAGEYHQTKFDGKNLSSGMYFARLTFEGKSQIRKLLLAK